MIRTRPTVWWVGMLGAWRPVFPVCAYPSIAETDAAMRSNVSPPGRLFCGRAPAWWNVSIIEHDWNHPRPGFETLDLGEVHLEPMDAERVAIMLEAARSDAREHPIREMRHTYERCAIYLDAVAQHMQISHMENA